MYQFANHSELGHREDLAFLQFAVCCLQNRDRRDKANNMRQLYQEHFQQPGNNRFLAQCVADYQHLLGRRSPSTRFGNVID